MGDGDRGQSKGDVAQTFMVAGAGGHAQRLGASAILGTLD